MKQKMLSLCAIAIMGMAQAYGGVTLTVPEVSIAPGGTSYIFINFDLGTPAYTAYQFDIAYPQGISSASDDSGNPAFLKGEVYSTEHNVSSIYASTGRDRFQCFSINSLPLTAQSGTLLMLPIKAEKTLALGTYQATIAPIEFVQTDATPDRPEAVTFNITVSKSLVLDENSIAPPATATGVNVTVKRTINAGEWTTICLPFALNGEQVVEAFGEGVQVADFTAWSSEEDSEGDITRITLGFETVTEMEANHPYIINVAEDITEFTLDGVDISPEEEPSVQVGKKKAERGFLTGTYVVADVPEEGLVLDGGQFAYSDGTRQTVAFSAYFELADALTDTGTAAACIDIVLDGVSINTAIGTAMDNTGVRGTAFTLDGIRVSKAVKGLYIQDGRIVLKK